MILLIFLSMFAYAEERFEFVDLDKVYTSLTYIKDDVEICKVTMKKSEIYDDNFFKGWLDNAIAGRCKTTYSDQNIPEIRLDQAY